jgi:hypothetical protein
MALTVTVRDVPENVREALNRVARMRGQSLQAFLMSVLKQQAEFSRNAELAASRAEHVPPHDGRAALLVAVEQHGGVVNP